jgi:hypothetical protein
MLHIILTSEMLLTHQHSLQYAVCRRPLSVTSAATFSAIVITATTINNLNTTQTLEYTKDKYNAKINK